VRLVLGVVTAGAALFAASACTTTTVKCGALPDDCAGVCTDVTSDSNNCGACGAACMTTQACSNGACVDATCTALPTIVSVTATSNGDGTIDLTIPFMDPCAEGVDAYTFRTADGVIDDIDVPVPLVASGSLVIQNLALPNESGDVAFQVQIFAGSRESAVATGSVSL